MLKRVLQQLPGQEAGVTSAITADVMTSASGCYNIRSGCDDIRYSINIRCFTRCYGIYVTSDVKADVF
jgi:hypothetical protein